MSPVSRRMTIGELREAASFYDCEVVTRHFIEDVRREQRLHRESLREIERLNAQLQRERRPSLWARLRGGS